MNLAAHDHAYGVLCDSHGQRARGMVASSESQSVAYTCLVRILEHLITTIYPRQDSARDGRLGSVYACTQSAMCEKWGITALLENPQPTVCETALAYLLMLLLVS